MQDVTIPVEFDKRAINEDQRLVGGFAYVSKRDGQVLYDSQGDRIDADDLREAVHDFMKSGRKMGIMHMKDADGEPVAGGEIVEMAVFAGDFRPPGMDPNVDAFWIVAKVENDHAWAGVKDGTFTGFSIGGKGMREAIT